MSAEKRRQNRIQGGVNQRGRGNPRGQRGSPRFPGQRTNFGYSPSSESSPLGKEFNATLLGSTLPDERQGEHSATGRKFIFEETNQVIREPPPVITEVPAGETILSEEPSGISKIKFYPDFLDEEYSNLLFLCLKSSLPWQENYVVIRGEKHKMPRKMCWFAPLEYAFSGSSLKGINGEWPETLLAIHDQIKQKTGFEFNSVLANLYEDEHNSVGWHSDDELLMKIDSCIASVSLGAVRSFELRKIPPPEENGDFTYMQHYRFALPNGSLLIMDGCMQKDWQHRIPKEYHSRKARINLTFRTVSGRAEDLKFTDEERKERNFKVELNANNESNKCKKIPEPKAQYETGLRKRQLDVKCKSSRKSRSALTASSHSSLQLRNNFNESLLGLVASQRIRRRLHLEEVSLIRNSVYFKFQWHSIRHLNEKLQKAENTLYLLKDNLEALQKQLKQTSTNIVSPAPESEVKVQRCVFTAHPNLCLIVLGLLVLFIYWFPVQNKGSDFTKFKGTHAHK